MSKIVYCSIGVLQLRGFARGLTPNEGAIYQIQIALSTNIFYFSKILCCSVWVTKLRGFAQVVPSSEGAIYHKAPLVSTLFLHLCDFFCGLGEIHTLPCNIALFLKQHVATAPLCNVIFSLLDYFFGATFTKRFFPTRRTYAPDASSASISLIGCSFTSTAPC